MTVRFADTFFFVAMLDATDHHHGSVLAHMAENDDFYITTRWILVETGNALGGSKFRSQTAKFLLDIEQNPDVKIVEPSDDLYQQGLRLYASRPDKSWSLTDSISFAVMKEQSLTEALTLDRHFAQAGFVPLFAVE
jgi:predicted nucleic acid-binding protein